MRQAKFRGTPVAVKEMIHTASEEQVQEELKGLMYVLPACCCQLLQ